MGWISRYVCILLNQFECDTNVLCSCRYCGFRPPKKERDIAGEVLGELEE